MLNIGPYSAETVLFFVACILAWLAAFITTKYYLKEVNNAEGLLVDALLIGLLSARMIYVALHWADYQAQLSTILTISDGGFHFAAGALSAGVFLIWRSRQNKPLRYLLLSCFFFVLLCYCSFGALNSWWKKSYLLPDVVLQTLEQAPINLADYQARPLVINLWATWCGPCRREMPVFAEMQKAFPELAILLINQGESSKVVTDYLSQQKLVLQDVLLDESRQMMQSLQVGALPTSLFFNKHGRLIYSHTGEMSRATLKQAIEKIQRAD